MYYRRLQRGVAMLYIQRIGVVYNLNSLEQIRLLVRQIIIKFEVYSSTLEKHIMLQSAVKINHWFTAAHIVMAGVTIVEQMLEFYFNWHAE